MYADIQRAALAGRLCKAAALLMLVILMMSATIRLARESCGDALAQSTLIVAARLIHRVAASTVGILLLAIAFLGLRVRPVPSHRLAVLGLLFVLTLFLAALGKFSGGSPAAIVTIGNVVAGVALLALFWRLALELAARPIFSIDRPQPWLSTLAFLASAFTALQIGLGGWLAGLRGAAACKGFVVGEAQTWWPDTASFGALNPFHNAPPALATAQALGNATGWLNSMHNFSSVLAIVLVFALAQGLFRSAQRLRSQGVALIGLLLFMVGLAIPLQIAQPLWLGVLHNALAALLMALLIGIQYRLQRE